MSLYLIQRDPLKIKRHLVHLLAMRVLIPKRPWNSSRRTLIKKKINFSSYIRKFRMEQLQSHIWLTTSSYMRKYLHISPYIRKPFLIYDFAIAPLWTSLYMRTFVFLFYQCRDSICIGLNSAKGIIAQLALSRSVSLRLCLRSKTTFWL